MKVILEIKDWYEAMRLAQKATAYENVYNRLLRLENSQNGDDTKRKIESSMHHIWLLISDAITKIELKNGITFTRPNTTEIVNVIKPFTLEDLRKHIDVVRFHRRKKIQI